MILIVLGMFQQMELATKHINHTKENEGHLHQKWEIYYFKIRIISWSFISRLYRICVYSCNGSILRSVLEICIYLIVQVVVSYLPILCIHNVTFIFIRFILVSEPFIYESK